MQGVETKKSTVFRSRSLKPPAIKNEIVARRAQGQSKSKIAKEVGVAPNTVSSIVALSQIDELLEDGRLGTGNLIPEALRVARVRLSKDSENMAIKVLENTIWPLQDKANGKKMSGDLTLNQTLNVLLHGDSKPPEAVSSDNSNVIEQAPASGTITDKS